MLDVVQFDSGKFKIVNQDFDLEKLVSQAIQLISIQAKFKGLKTYYKFSKNIKNHIKSDCNRIRQVILNFLSNSLKFTKIVSICPFKSLWF